MFLPGFLGVGRSILWIIVINCGQFENPNTLDCQEISCSLGNMVSLASGLGRMFELLEKQAVNVAGGWQGYFFSCFLTGRGHQGLLEIWEARCSDMTRRNPVICAKEIRSWIPEYHSTPLEDRQTSVWSLGPEIKKHEQERDVVWWHSSYVTIQPRP